MMLFTLILSIIGKDSFYYYVLFTLTSSIIALSIYYLVSESSKVYTNLHIYILLVNLSLLDSIIIWSELVFYIALPNKNSKYFL